MTKPQILEFIDCNAEKMRGHYARHASSVIPYLNPCPISPKPKCAKGRMLDGKTVTDCQQTWFLDGEGAVKAIIFRVSFANEQPVDFPMLFVVGNTVYRLTDF